MCIISTCGAATDTQKILTPRWKKLSVVSEVDMQWSMNLDRAFASSVHSHTGTRDGLAARRRSLREDMAPKSKRKAKRKRTDAQDARAVAIEGLAAGHEHASDMGIYRHAGREVNGRGVWASVGHHAAYLFYSAMGSWCVSNEADMEAGEHQGSLMVESDAATPHAITESWSVHGTMSKTRWQ